ncbi:MAG: DUF1707 domain-containing protein [Actinomycetota bacterium]|nr:DUF1707 domain-containing protein [Actinomycetota bacterium]MDQ2956801.1 DUF1707 domain-containing protein [Actinomycetota bacterium]
MTEPAGDDGVRIGTAEREAALKALEEHLVAGRLELDEYGERSAKVSVARTSSELIPLFADLPLPHASPAPDAAAQPRRVNPREVRRNSTGPLGGPLFGRFGETVVALSPFVALALFFALGAPWFVFLLIPASGALVYGNAKGGRRHDRHHHDRH